jgi:hypothetical protein
MRTIQYRILYFHELVVRSLAYKLIKISRLNHRLNQFFINLCNQVANNFVSGAIKKQNKNTLSFHF